MTETIAVLFIFFVLVGFGLIFYYKWQEGSLKQERQEMRAARAMDTTLKVLYLPELMCTRGQAVPEDNCVDMAKVRMLLGVIRDEQGEFEVHDEPRFFETHQDYYYEVFGISKIVLHDLSYASRAAGGQIPDGDNPENEALEAQDDQNEIRSYVLYDKRLSGAPDRNINYEPTYFVVALRDYDLAHQEKYGFGYLEVGVYGESG